MLISVQSINPLLLLVRGDTKNVRAHIDKYIKWTELHITAKHLLKTFAAELSSSQVQKRPLNSENYDIMFCCSHVKTS